MKLKLTLFALLIITLFSCTGQDKIFKGYEFINEEKLKLFIISSEVHPDTKFFSEEFSEGIEITDKETIKSILEQSSIGKDQPFLPHFGGLFSVKGKVLANFYLNEDFTKIHTPKGDFKIDKKNFIHHIDNFHPLKIVKIKIVSREEAISIRNLLADNEVQMKWDVRNPPEWVKFKGKIVLEVNKTYRSSDPKIKLEELLKQDLKGYIDNFDLVNYKLQNDKSKVVLYCDDLKGNLPVNFSLIEPFSEFSNIMITILGSDKNDVIQLFNNNNIENYTIE